MQVRPCKSRVDTQDEAERSAGRKRILATTVEEDMEAHSAETVRDSIAESGTGGLLGENGVRQGEEYSF